jgi:HK97 gp10 family phage protein
MTEYVTGLREVVRNLEKIGVDVQDLKEVFTNIGEMVRADAAALAPRDSGRLAASIKPSKTKNKAAVRAGSARVPYAGAINYGWAKRHIRAHNFMQRAIDADTPRAIEMMDEGIGEIIRRYGMAGPDTH